jgi:hypothetical protein
MSSCITQDAVPPLSHYLSKLHILQDAAYILRNIEIKTLSLLWRRKSELYLVPSSRQAIPLTESGRTIEATGQPPECLQSL